MTPTRQRLGAVDSDGDANGSGLKVQQRTDRGRRGQHIDEHDDRTDRHGVQQAEREDQVDTDGGHPFGIGPTTREARRTHMQR